jgi:hypothetical protein
MRTTF